MTVDYYHGSGVGTQRMLVTVSQRFLSYSQLAPQLRLLFFGRVVTSSTDKPFLTTFILQAIASHWDSTTAAG
jgi:hypothetical protein